MSRKERISYLFHRYYEKTATEEEKKEFFLVVNSISDEELSILTAEAFERAGAEVIPEHDIKAAREIEKILTPPAQTATPVKRLFPLWSKIAVAASFILIVGSIFYFSTTKVEKPVAHYTPKSRPVNDAVPGANKAILTLSDGSSIALDDAGNGVVARQGQAEVRKTSGGQIVYSRNPADAPASSAQMNRITTPRGGQFQIVLPDGTKAWLNAASSISFPAVFTKDVREITMTGEVYLEVVKNTAPFVVHSAKGTIRVLGTHFNIMAYEDEKAMETTLLEGSIQLVSGSATRILAPGQQALSANEGDIRMAAGVDTGEVIAWKTGLFQFRDADIETIMRQISRWYDVDVTYKGAMPQKQINGKISRNVKASEVLEMLSYTGINFTIEGNRIIVTP